MYNEQYRRLTGLVGASLWALTLTACGSTESKTSAETAAIETLAQPLTASQIQAECLIDPRVTLGEVSMATCVGAGHFFRDPFGGNGRTCASCHPVDHNYTIDPDFIATLPANDPLFVAETNTTLAALEKPALMRQFGLILENVDGLSSPTSRFTMRSVPHCFSLSTSITPQPIPNDGTTLPPLQRTGWSGDGAPNSGQLRDFQTGAVVQHYTKSLDRTPGVDFVLPTSGELDAIVSFMGTVGRSNELDLTQLSLSDAGAEAGRLKYIAPATRCNACHRNAGANNAAAANRNFNTGVERARFDVLNQNNIPFDGGFGGASLASFNFDANGDGTFDSFGNGTFNTPPLIEAADTGPFFHTNTSTTIEDAITFYTTPAFANSPAGGGNAIALTATDIANLGRFLRVLNVAFNVQLAEKRVSGVIPIISSEKNHFRQLQQELARLALVETEDALEILTGVSSLNPVTQALLNDALTALQVASTHASHTHRLSNAQTALSLLQQASDALSSSGGVSALSFVMGEGTLMF